MTIKKNRVLVTGTTGFVGSHLVQKLAEEKYDIICLVAPGESIDLFKDLTSTPTGVSIPMNQKKTLVFRFRNLWKKVSGLPQNGIKRMAFYRSVDMT